VPGAWQSKCDALQLLQGETEAAMLLSKGGNLSVVPLLPAAPEPGRVCDRVETAFRSAY